MNLALFQSKKFNYIYNRTAYMYYICYAYCMCMCIKSDITYDISHNYSKMM